MNRTQQSQLLCLALSLALTGCRATAPAPLPHLPATPPPIVDGSYSMPPFAAGGAPLLAQQPVAPPCAEDEVKPKRGWRQWLPTKDHSNDPNRERGQTTDGWYEPEFRGISD